MPLLKIIAIAAAKAAAATATAYLMRNADRMLSDLTDKFLNTKERRSL